MNPQKPSDNHSPTDCEILELISYNRELHDKYTGTYTTVESILNKIQPDRVNWINVDGLNNQDLIEKVQTHFCLHSLLIDDVLSDQRPKAEEFDDYLFFTLKMLYRIDGTAIDYEQISFVLGKNYLISFQEKEGDWFDGFRDRIRLDQGRVRKKQADYLLYRLIDIIVDNYYNVLDRVGDLIDETEETVYQNPSTQTFTKIQYLKKELIYLRKALFPLRDALSKIVKGESDFVKEENIRFFSDVYEHVIHLTDSLETYKDLVSSLTDIHINAMNTKMNEVMKVLTVISTIFIPLTFIVGVYGMNFHYMPELDWRWGYYSVWGVMILIVVGMLAFFRHKKWF
ncbi:magnesium/cobalt transporter CorA [Ohtaekwangia koreensis]|uniref:Magnesium transport protein CorA n=1 Tax=Ohtaekwangia koreensis TaxID=688867 RepID=A0A1T5ME70_9BACT|nr:magnesium/cobalt transporter CorA [Ohtaekwangia koreensis]SKC86383.1 magnesium transporter [Ohtaekwangia koreensis]